MPPTLVTELQALNLETLLSNPLFLFVLAVAILLTYQYVRQMPYSEFVLLTQLKHRVFLLLDPFARKRGLRLVTNKGYREDDEFLTTIDFTPRVLAKRFKEEGIDQHIISGSKRRETPEGRQWSHSHYTYQHADGMQTEIWLYTNPDGSTDIYSHYEESVFDPDGHLETPYTPGDPKGVLDDILPG